MRTTFILAVAAAGLMWLGGVGRAGTDPAGACKDTKARAAGRKAADLITAFGRNFKRPDPVRLEFSILKAQSKFTKQFSKAESKGGCATVDDVAAIEAKVDALVSVVVGNVSGPTTTTTTTSTTTTTTILPPACDCCGVADQLSFTTTTPIGNCGVLRNFRCSNDANLTCSGDLDCDLDASPCIIGPDVCLGNFSISCTSDADCMSSGTCDEVIASGLPQDLACGLLYHGGGGVSMAPAGISDTMTVVADVTGCDSGTGALTLGPSTSGQTGSSLTCTSAGCLFGAPVPFDSSLGPPFSMCGIATLAQDATGVGDCDGEMRLDFSIAVGLHLGGDLLQAATPPDVPGIQACPLCVRQCGGGTNDRFPCTDDTDCTGGGTCGVGTECLGGDNDTDPCTPGSTDLGAGFPTSQDCQPTAALLIHTAPLEVTLSAAESTVNAVDHANQVRRTFCGFCRDIVGNSSLCFEGDTGAFCPSGGASTAVACQSDADCDDGDEYETCAQRNPGAFAKGAATRLTMTGSAAGQCLVDGLPRPTTVGGSICFAPSFDPTLDALYDWPGPGALTLQGEVTLLP